MFPSALTLSTSTTVQQIWSHWLHCDLNVHMDKDAMCPVKGSRREGWCVPSPTSPPVSFRWYCQHVGTGNPRFHLSSSTATSFSQCSQSAVAERVQCQELVKREVISECFIERQTCTIRSKFSVSLDGDSTNVFLLTRGWEVAYEVCSSLNFKKSFSLVKSVGRSFTAHVIRCGANDLNDTCSNSSEMQESKTTLTNTVHLTKRGRLSSRWKG